MLRLDRLGREQIEAMIFDVAGQRALPSEMYAQIISKTDGVPLFVEELTKSVLESGLLEDAGDQLTTVRAPPAACDSYDAAWLADGPPGSSWTG